MNDVQVSIEIECIANEAKKKQEQRDLVGKMHAARSREMPEKQIFFTKLFFGSRHGDCFQLRTALTSPHRLYAVYNGRRCLLTLLSEANTRRNREKPIKLMTPTEIEVDKVISGVCVCVLMCNHTRKEIGRNKS